jgi:transcriptional regulator with XRE-family HTH domain
MVKYISILLKNIGVRNMKIEESKKTKLRKLMDSKGLTAEKLSNITGVNRNIVIDLTNNKRELNVKYAYELAPALNVSVEYLLNAKDSKELIINNLQNIQLDMESNLLELKTNYPVLESLYKVLSNIYNIYNSNNDNFTIEELESLNNLFYTKIENTSQTKGIYKIDFKDGNSIELQNVKDMEENTKLIKKTIIEILEKSLENIKKEDIKK